MDRSKSPSNINGWMLDFLGTLLGIVRPTRTATGLTYWGFQNQPGAGTFGQVPFWTAESGLETRVPVDDGIYRGYYTDAPGGYVAALQKKIC